MYFDNLDSNDLPRLVYLILLLAVLASGFMLRSNLKASQLVKQAALWLLIGLTAIIIYSFRYDFYNLKNRVAAELLPNKAVRLNNRQISINVASDGHFYVYLNINNRPLKFMVDTGASDIVLSVNEARRVGIDINNLSFSKIYQTANGTIFGARAIAEKLEIADLEFYNVPVSVSNSDMGVSLLGMSFLRQFKKYEFYQNKLILTY